MRLVTATAVQVAPSAAAQTAALIKADTARPPTLTDRNLRLRRRHAVGLLGDGATAFPWGSANAG
jgi:hypothetical protein